jgi:transposase
MAREFAGVDRGQLLLMPPSLAEWLPEEHLVWSVLGAVEQMDLRRFAERYRLGAAGRPPLDPAVMVALLLYAYARGIRSSRAIERACLEDVAFKVITGMRTPDHSTIAEFRRRHEAEIGELFDEVLGLCREAGLVSVGVITIDGTKIKANASMDQNRDYRQLVTEILREAEEVDRREDELYGEARGDELPEQLRTAEGRRQALADAKRRLAERKRRSAGDEAEPEPEKLEMDLESMVLGRRVLKRGGRIEWLRVARRELEAHRTRQGAPVARDRDDRMIDALERLEENHRVDLAAVESYERWRATARDTKGRVLKGNSKPFVAPELPEGKINLSDPDSRVMRTQGTPPRQAYNAQASVNDQQVILAAEITNAAPDFGQLAPMFQATIRELAEQGVSDTPEVMLADAGYWHHPQMQQIGEQGIEVLVPPDGNLREGKRRGWEHGVYEQMREKLSTDRGRELYAQRKVTIEPVFGQIKYNRRIDRFMRRGRAAAQSEWRLVTATHNLLKLHSHWIATAA